MKRILHCDSRTHPKIDGAWLLLILIFSDNRRFSLSPVFLAFEDRDHTVRLFLQTYHPFYQHLLCTKTQEFFHDKLISIHLAIRLFFYSNQTNVETGILNLIKHGK